MKRIGLLTSGGDCGGLNAVLRGAASAALGEGVEPVLILAGYAGLVNLVDRATPVPLDRATVEGIDALLAGSRAGNSRVKVSKISDPEKYERIRAGLARHGVEGLVIAGGDDTGSVVVDLAGHGVRCVHAPKTMDLDISTYSVGGDSTVNRIAHFISDLRTTGETHGRIMVVEIFGRYAGHTTFRGGVAAGADCILIPEVDANMDLVYRHLKGAFLRRLTASPTRTATSIAVVAEGFRGHQGDVLADESVRSDAFGHKKLGGAGRLVREYLASRVAEDHDIPAAYRELGLFVEGMNTAPEVREVVPGYLVRSGPASALDAVYGLDLGIGAVHLLLQGQSGVTVTGVRDGTVEFMPAAEAIRSRQVSEEMIALYESAGVFFGRAPQNHRPALRKVEHPWTFP